MHKSHTAIGQTARQSLESVTSGNVGSKILDVRYWDSFADCENEVREFIEEHSRNPFLGFDWLRKHYEHIDSPAGREALLAGVYRNSKLVCFAPLYSRRRALGVREVGIIGYGLSDYPGLAGEESLEVLDALVESISARWPNALYQFHDIIDGSPLDKAITQSELFTVSVQVPLYECLWRDLESAEATNGRSSKKKLIRRLRSLTRRLSKLGGLQFVKLDFDEDPVLARQMYPELMHLQWLRHNGTLNAWCEPANRSFLEEYVRQARPSNVVGYVTLLDNVPIAFDLALRKHSRIVLFVAAIHPAFRPFGVGHLNCQFIEEQCLRDGYRFVDFSKGGGHLKRTWTDGKAWQNRHILVRGSSLFCRVTLLCDTLKFRLTTWGRRKGYNQHIRRALARVTKRAEPDVALPDSEPMASPAIPAGMSNFRFGVLADLPVPVLIDVVKAAYRLTTEGDVECERLPDRVLVRSAETGTEVEIVIPAGRIAHSGPGQDSQDEAAKL